MAQSPSTNQQKITTLVLGLFCILGSFAFGMSTNQNSQPAQLIEAGRNDAAGDMNQNGQHDLEDIIIILEATQGYRTLTPIQEASDPNLDGQITVDDALMLLNLLSL